MAAQRQKDYFTERDVQPEAIVFEDWETVAWAGFSKRVTPHTLRHSFTTHLLASRVGMGIETKTELGERDLLPPGTSWPQPSGRVGSLGHAAPVIVAYIEHSGKGGVKRENTMGGRGCGRLPLTPYRLPTSWSGSPGRFALPLPRGAAGGLDFRPTFG